MGRASIWIPSHGSGGVLHISLPLFRLSSEMKAQTWATFSAACSEQWDPFEHKLPLTVRPLNELWYIPLMFHLQGWPCDGYSLLMLARDKSYEPPPTPPCQGHTHHRFTGLSAQVMHGSYSQSVWGSIYNKVCEAATNSSLLRPQYPCSAGALTKVLLYDVNIL